MKMRSTLACLLLLVLLLSVGCSAPSDVTDQTTEQTTEAETVQTRPAVSDNTSGDLGKRTVEILARNDGAFVEFENVRDGSASILGEAIYRRNITVQTRLNCTLVFSYTNGLPGDAESYIEIATKDEKYDIFASHNLVMPQLAIKGGCADLIDLQNDTSLDLSSPWWPNNLTEMLSYDGSLYFCTGDISTNYVSSLYGVYFNKDILKANGIDPVSIYRIVENGVWTLEALAKYSAECAGEINGEATYGFALGVNPEYVEAFYCAANFTPTEKNEDGTLSFSMTDKKLEEEKSFLKNLNELFSAETSSVSWSNASNGTARFTMGRAAFTVSPLSYAKEIAGKVSYGVIPLPVSKVRTDTYLTPISDGYTFYAVRAKNVENDVENAAVLQSLAATAYNVNANAYYNGIMATAFDFADPNVRMVENMKQNGCFEFFECWLSAYTSDEGEKISNPSQLFASCVINSSATHIAESNYVSLINKYRPIYSDAFDGFIKAMTDK